MAGGANAHWFDFIGPALAQHGRVVALDLRGHGDSTPAEPPVYTYDAYMQDLRAVFEAERMALPILMGHSMGGMLTVKYAGTWPQEVQALIVRNYAAARTRSNAGKAACDPWRMRRRLSCRQVHPCTRRSRSTIR